MSSKTECAAVTARVLQGDAFELIRNLPSDSVDLLITSPPYWGLRTYDLDHNWQIDSEWRSISDKESIPSYQWYRQHGGLLGLEPYPDWYIAHLVEFFELARPVLKETGSLWINVGDTYFARWSSIRNAGRQGLGANVRQRRRVPMGAYRQEKQLLLIPARFAIGMQERKWILRNDLIWYKPNIPPRPEKDRLKLAHEHLFHFVLKPKIGRAKYYYDKQAVEAHGNDVVTCLVRAGQESHTATFPEGLIAPRILSSCPPVGTVLDPFCGTGRSLAIAKKFGRNSVGFELSPEYAASAQRILNQTLALA
ncbi:MAG TPA: site-specific DNA-methyltransferase [Terriglobia bacterium]|nr:site-specific DNA-methyltransferase [Terriglobia bacterium]